MRWSPLAAVAVVLLAGCGSPPAEQGAPEDTQDTAETASSDPTDGGQDTAVPDSRFGVPDLGYGLEFANCEGWEFGLPWPTVPQPVPSWGEGTGVPSVHVEGYRCERVTLGGLVRGPVAFVMEYTDRVVVPAACMEGAPSMSLGYGIISMGLDDVAVGAALASLGLPVYELTMAFEELPPAEAGTKRASWGPAGSEASEMTFTRADPQVTDMDFARRLFWTNGTGLTAWQLEHEQTGPDGGSQPAAGTLHEPMVLADLPAYAFAGDWHATAVLRGSLYGWLDQECQTGAGPPS